MTLEEMKQRKKELGIHTQGSRSCPASSEYRPENLWRATTAPRYDTMLALESLLVPAPSQTASASARQHPIPAHMRSMRLHFRKKS